MRARASLPPLTRAPDYDDYNFEKREYKWFNAYAESKLVSTHDHRRSAGLTLCKANIHFSQYLAQVLGPRGVLSIAVHPGSASSPRLRGRTLTRIAAIGGTNLVSTLPEDELVALKAYVASKNVKEKTLAQGAATTLVAVLDPALKEQNGAYLADCNVAPTLCEAAQRQDLPEKLWRISETLVNEIFAY